MPDTLLGYPAYTGVRLHSIKNGGFSIWLPSDWHKIPLRRRFRGFMFSPYPDDINTSILVEKKKLQITITQEDTEVLREAFHTDIKSLPGVEIEILDEKLSETVNVFDARFTFLEGENRRKRWVRNIYWGDGQLIVIAQGRDVKDFEFWLPMFFNAITTLQIL
ncbi:MAG TPA: hypothetical protein VIO61_11410 [Anaerolineaceae bacterium]